jgi:hypothetical protein
MAGRCTGKTLARRPAAATDRPVALDPSGGGPRATSIFSVTLSDARDRRRMLAEPICAAVRARSMALSPLPNGRSVLLVEGGCRRHDLARRRMICLRDTVMHPGCLSARALPGRCGRPAITFVVCILMNPAPSLRCSCRCGQTTHPRRRNHPWTRSSACERTSGPISITRSGTWPTPPACALSFSAKRGRGAVPADRCRRACALARPA